MFSVGRAVRSPRSQRSSAPNNHRNSESEIYRTVAKHHVSEGNTRRLLEKENRFFCVRCISKKLSLSCGKAKTMRPHSELSLRVRRLIASPRKAECISGAEINVVVYRCCAKNNNLLVGRVTAVLILFSGKWTCVFTLFHHVTDIQFLRDNPQFVKCVGDFLLFLDNVLIYFIHAVFTSFNGLFNGSLINIKNGSEHFG